MSSTRESVVIIGSGPAAWTAAIYTARANLNPLVYEGELSPAMIPGGQLMWTTDIENFPGFPEPVGGQELMARLKAQAERYGTRVVQEDIVDVEFTPSTHWLTTSGGTRLEALGGDHRDRRARQLARACPTRSASRATAAACRPARCATARSRTSATSALVVVGGGDSAMEEAHLPDQVRERGDPRAPPRRLPRVEGDGGSRAGATRRSASSGTRRPSRCSATTSSPACA